MPVNDTGQCVVCGEAFPPGATSRRMTCSQRCRTIKSQTRREEWPVNLLKRDEPLPDRRDREDGASTVGVDNAARAAEKADAQVRQVFGDFPEDPVEAWAAWQNANLKTFSIDECLLTIRREMRAGKAWALTRVLEALFLEAPKGLSRGRSEAHEAGELGPFTSGTQIDEFRPKDPEEMH